MDRLISLTVVIVISLVLAERHRRADANLTIIWW